MKTILMKFAGPMQSWGTDSHFETRHTDYYPSKSAVIGLIAAAIGYGRDQSNHIRELNDLLFAVRIDQPGRLLRDYHIAQKYKKDGSLDRNYVSNRFYMEDAVYVVAISGADEQIDRIFDHLKYPYFQLYMGRRALPVTADFLLSKENLEIMDALRNCRWQAALWHQRSKRDQKDIYLDVYGDELALGKSDRPQLRRDYVVTFSQKGRTFEFRKEGHTRICVTNPECFETTHDIFDNLG